MPSSISDTMKKILKEVTEHSVHYHLGDQSIDVGILPGFSIDTKDIFEEE
ncbi:MAG: hypothetical protein LBE35_07050 [Clostridiales bacterium]|jgi:hypothetical protein|nr:hypothetical protein [Clostridiales bacterium]